MVRLHKDILYGLLFFKGNKPKAPWFYKGYKGIKDFATY